MSLKLFVWHDVLTDYTSGVMFALAHDVEEARKLIHVNCSYLIETDLELQPTVYDAPIGFAVWGGG